MTPKYRADIDGLRAIAVLSVLFFHMKSPVFSGGYVGVDIFFVISGYLITTIIIREIANNDFSIAQFYERRFRRILPALTVVITISLATGSLLLHPNTLIDLGKSAIATTLFSSNILFYFESGYFDGPAELKPLLHTWSLAVEEQFYIFFPLLLVLIARAGTRHYLKWLVVLGSLSFVACVLGTNVNASGAFYLIPARAWELFMGSILALHALPIPKGRHIRELLSISGITLIAVGIFRYTSGTHFPGIAATMPTIGTALIIYSGFGGQTFISNILSQRPLVFIGLISYSLYLWHWPVMVYTRYYSIVELNTVQTGVMLAVILILSILSWRYVETPFRKKKLLASRHSLLTTSLVVSLAILCGGLVLVVKDGLPDRYENTVADNPGGTDSEWEYWTSCEGVTKRINNNQELCDIGMPEGEPSFILWGDSHAKALASGVDLSAKTLGVRGKIATQSACPPLLSIERPHRTSCYEFNQVVLREISNSPRIKTVILAARWALSTTGTRYKQESGSPVRLVDLQSPSNMDLSNRSLFEIGLMRTVDRLHSLGKNVVLVMPVPEIGFDVPSTNFISEITGRNVSVIISPTTAEYTQRIRDVTFVFAKIMKDYQIQIVNPASYLCKEDYCRVIDQGTLLYRDDDHLSTFGSRYISQIFDIIFREIVPSTQ